VRICSEHAVGYLKGRFQSLQGLRQQINSAQDYALALAWVWVCIIVHSLAACYEEGEEDDHFWQWVHDGLLDQPNEGDNCNPVDGFSWGLGEELITGESLPQRKWRHVQESLFDVLYS